MCVDPVIDSELVEVEGVPVKNVENDPTQLLERSFSRNRKLSGPIRKELPVTNREVASGVWGVLDAQ